MSNIDKDVAAMLSSLKKLDNAAAQRLSENRIYTGKPGVYGVSNTDAYIGDDIPEPTDAELRSLEDSGEVDAALAAAKSCCDDGDSNTYAFSLNESDGVDADPDQIMQLAARYKAGEITYDEFKSEMETLEYTDYSMRQGEMGNPDMRDDWAYQDSVRRGDWAGSDEYDDDEYDDEEADEAEFLEAVSKSQIPAVHRKASGDKDWKLTQKDLDDEEESKISSQRGLDKLQRDTGVKEAADPEVIAWMERLSRLG